MMSSTSALIVVIAALCIGQLKAMGNSNDNGNSNGNGNGNGHGGPASCGGDPHFYCTVSDTDFPLCYDIQPPSEIVKMFDDSGVIVFASFDMRPNPKGTRNVTYVNVVTVFTSSYSLAVDTTNIRIDDQQFSSWDEVTAGNLEAAGVAVTSASAKLLDLHFVGVPDLQVMISRRSRFGGFLNLKINSNGTAGTGGLLGECLDASVVDSTETLEGNKRFKSFEVAVGNNTHSFDTKLVKKGTKECWKIQDAANSWPLEFLPDFVLDIPNI